jgi:hypothetical protein
VAVNVWSIYSLELWFSFVISVWIKQGFWLWFWVVISVRSIRKVRFWSCVVDNCLKCTHIFNCGLVR